MTCSIQHAGQCTTPVKCFNCGDEHRSDYNQCPSWLKEVELLKYKCQTFLSFVDERRKVSQKSEPKSYARITSKQIS